ncbi:hypothetical protein M758_3G192200 [Ceratodon purpureus]|nr:hypothetical protein M758_3G192200 [Ceratodon purpureus]
MVKVTIVTSSSRLLEFLGPKAGAKALKWLKKKKVEVLYNDKVDPDAKVGNIYTTRSGKKIEAELHFWCVGKKLGNDWLKNSEFKGWLDNTGHLRVDKSMRLVDIPNVFCAGDMTDIKEIKQGFLASKHANVVAENIKKLMKDPNCKKLSEYQRLEEPFGLVTLGRSIAVAQFPCCTCIGCLPGMMKSKDLFVGNARQSLGLPY